MLYFYKSIALVSLATSVQLTTGLAAEPTSADARAALRKATAFMKDHVAVDGGYVWLTSGDLQHRMGEGRAKEHVIWVQPPGTPTIGQAFLDAYDATGDGIHLDAARAAAQALVRGQLLSGGWNYHIDFSRENPRRLAYRRGAKIPARRKADSPGGWDEWKRGRHKGNITVLDDDTTQAAVRFLKRMDRALKFEDKSIHEAASYALESLLRAQYPGGGWSASFDTFPRASPSSEHYPVKRANFPDQWPRKWPKDYTGCYVINDDLMQDMIATMLLAHEIYDDERFLDSAKRAGDFLLLAQLPDPQPAWAQQYDRHMQPVWSRAFEPPAVTGGESHGVMRALMQLYQYTGEKKYLQPIPQALAYLRRSRLDNGRLARFYELKTNRPLYFEYDADRRHQLTYSDRRLPDHYGFIINGDLDDIEEDYQRLLKMNAEQRQASRRARPPRLSNSLKQLAAKVITAQDDRGAWTEEGVIRDENNRKLAPEAGIISSRTFVSNMRVLCRFVRASGARPSR